MFSRKMQSRIVYIGKFAEMQPQVKQGNVFVAHPFFGGDAHKLADYRIFIRDGLAEIGYAPLFARDDPGYLLETICQDIIDTEAGIYDVTGYNANVLIELGMSIGLNQPTVVIARDDAQPLLPLLEALNPLRYQSGYDLSERIGAAVKERLQAYHESGLNPRFCAACNRECVVRKARLSPEDEYLVIGADPERDKAIFHHLKKAVKNFNLTWQEIEGDFQSAICEWMEAIRRCKLIFFHSKEGTTRHSGMGNAATMVRVGMAVGLGVAWRMVLKQGERLPTDLEGFKYTPWDDSPTAFEAALTSALRQLYGETRPYRGSYDALPVLEVTERQDDNALISELLDDTPKLQGETVAELFESFVEIVTKRYGEEMQVSLSVVEGAITRLLHTNHRVKDEGSDFDEAALPSGLDLILEHNKVLVGSLLIRYAPRLDISKLGFSQQDMAYLDALAAPFAEAIVRERQRVQVRRILIVDPTIDLADTLAGMLTDEFTGVTVDIAASYDEAVKFLESRTYDVAVTEIRLDEEDFTDESGLELMQVFKGYTTFIVLTGYATIQVALKVLRPDGDTGRSLATELLEKTTDNLRALPSHIRRAVEQKRSSETSAVSSPKSLREFRIFLSSPSDVRQERDDAQTVVDEMNADGEFSNYINLKLIRWDDPSVVKPNVGSIANSGDTLTYMLKPSECDLVLVIFWSRMGTPIMLGGREYLSSAHYEFTEALDGRRGGKPTVWLYRCMQELQVELGNPEAEERLEQYKRMKQFFAQFEDFDDTDGLISGGVNEYPTHKDFKLMFKQQLITYLRHLSGKWG